ncbi:MAG TPA: nickel pincer cofactor biosynthesis protein LarB [Spirochaetota bacterium]|nr:nickel pincer cofactor biosynthesis protein LarB [Spirochaetota bacterium]
MGNENLRQLLENYKNGSISEDEALAYLKHLPFEDITFAKVDHHRELRWGFPEVIFCQGKTSVQVAAIARSIVERGSNLLATRADADAFDAVARVIPEARYNEEARTISLVKNTPVILKGRVLVATAGTADLPVAAESLETGIMLGLDISMTQDIGVAGIHRVMNHREEILEAAVIIVVAGMEGALASVIAGMVTSPVIAVPASTGYGAAFGGLASLLGMLNSCVPGVAVMNIDNGFGAAFLAFKTLKTLERLAQTP